MSKTFVANAILNSSGARKAISGRQLVEIFPDFKNRSGLADNRYVANDAVFYLTAKDAENWYPEMRVDSLLFEPGSRFEYSNPVFNGMALIIEKLSGMPWQRFVEENIFKPSGMKTSSVTDGPHPQQGVAHGYIKNHGQWIEDDYGEEPTFAVAGNGGVWSSVEERAMHECDMLYF